MIIQNVKIDLFAMQDTPLVQIILTNKQFYTINYTFSKSSS